MKSTTELIVHGSLKKEIKNHSRYPITIELDNPMPLSDILRWYQIPQELVQIVMVNHRAVPMETQIRPGDRLTLFPLEYPIFADWNDFRIRDEKEK